MIKVLQNLLRLFWVLVGVMFLQACTVMKNGAEPAHVLNHFGSFTQMMRTGDTAGRVALLPMDNSAGGWGLGALAKLSGEVIQVDGKILVSRGHAANGLTSPPSEQDSAVLWAGGKVSEWSAVVVPTAMRQAEFENFVREQASRRNINLQHPFIFRVSGSFPQLIWHVLTDDKASASRPAGLAPPTGAHAQHQAPMKVFSKSQALGQLVGVYSAKRLEGVVTHPEELFHVHYVNNDQTASGHVDEYSVDAGATLYLPEAPYKPKAQFVSGKAYAIVGPLGQRSANNAGLNANYGFIVGPSGVILIDSGASDYSAQLIEAAVSQVTNKPIRWVINTGSQDHRWLGNQYFAAKGAQIHALRATVNSQQSLVQQQLANLERFVGRQIAGVKPSYASHLYDGTDNVVNLGGIALRLIRTNAHLPGDAMVFYSDASTVFTGDLVYLDRILTILPQSDVREAVRAFKQLQDLAPKFIVPGHGRVSDMQHAKRETRDYYQFLVQHIGSAARNLEPMSETLDQHAKPKAFEHLANFADLHRANMNRVFLDFESRP